MLAKAIFKEYILKSFGWLILQRVVTQLIVTSSNLIIFRIIFPEDFGAYTIILFFMNLIWIFADFGLGKALIQRKETPDVILLRSVWWTHLSLGIIVASLIWIFSPIILLLYDGHINATSVFWLRILGFAQIFFNMNLVSVSLAERSLKYKHVFIGECLGIFITQMTTIYLSLKGLGVGSFALGFLLGKIVTLFTYYLLAPWGWGFNWQFGRLKSLLKFGFPEQTGQILALFNIAVIPLFLGKFPGPGNLTGSEAVGFVTWANGVAIVPLFIAELVEKLMFPLMSRLQEDLLSAKKIFTKIFATTVLVSFIGCTLVFILASEITQVVYTVRWFPALPSLRLAIIHTFLFVLTRIILASLLAFGETKFYRNMYLLCSVLQWILTVPLVLIFGFWGLNLASVLVAITGILAFVRLNKYFKVDYLHIVSTPLLASVVTGLIIIMLNNFLPIASIIHLILISIFGFVFYLCLIFSLMEDEFKEELRLILTAVSSLRLIKLR